MRDRLRAFIVHLLISAVIGLLALIVVFHIWYPLPLHNAVGVTDIFVLLLAVDVVLGPLLTFVVFRLGKKTLVFDVAVIAFVQISALGYGLWTLAEGRPAWLVFNADRFDVVQVVDIDVSRLKDALDAYRCPGWTGPRWIGADRPQDIDRRNEILFEAVLGGSDIAQRPELYRPLEDFEPMMKEKALKLNQLAEFNELEVVARELDRWPQATGWLPLMARAQPMVVLLTHDNSQVLTIVELKPWL